MNRVGLIVPTTASALAGSLAIIAVLSAAGCGGVSRDAPQGESARDTLERALVEQSPVTRCNGECQTFRPVDARCQGDGVVTEAGPIFFRCDVTFDPEGNDQTICVAAKTVDGEQAFETRALTFCGGE